MDEPLPELAKHGRFQELERSVHRTSELHREGAPLGDPAEYAGVGVTISRVILPLRNP
jgi:hypothetical protein